MLEIKNVTKIYKTKKENITALDNINLSFGKQGFIVVLGKSGSGKSSLLNVIGGLDQFDSGEIKIKDSLFNNYNDYESDIYRSKYIGFVFQEFNIIEDLTIGENISLALELQGYSKEEINFRVENILNQVDLNGYKHRKPNEISGGQKQRVALARALIKNPQIILADEPTGNLDSETGRLILKTLKNISKTKLVIMVTHDKDFAYEYGDRIIKLEDGKVISDTINLKQLDTEDKGIKEIIKINRGQKLNEDIINRIKTYLKNDTEDIYLMISENNIIESNKEEKVYEDSVQQCLDENNLTTLTLKESSLSLMKILKLSYHYLFIRKFRLFVMSLLFIFSLILVGITLNLSFYNSSNAAVLTFEKSNIKVIPFYKEGYYSSLTDKEINNLAKDFSSIQMVKIIHMNKSIDYDSFSFNKVIIYNDFNQENFNLLSGGYPENLYEIMITETLANELIETQFFPNISSTDNLIGKYFTYYNKQLLITGIVKDDIKNNDILLSQALYMSQETFNRSINTMTSINVTKLDNIKEYPISAPDLSYENFLINGSHFPQQNNEIVITLSKWSNYSNPSDYLGEKVIMNLDSYSDYSNDHQFTIVGVIDDINNNVEVPFKMMLSKDDFDYVTQENHDFRVTGIAYLNNFSQLKKLLITFDELNYRHNTNFSSVLYNFEDLLIPGKRIIFSIASVFILITILLLYVYISFSIVNKQKDIGILRALGTTYKDVSKIFVFEALIIGIFTGIISNILVIIIIRKIDNYLKNMYHMPVTILYNNVYSIILVLLVSTLIAFVASYISIKKYRAMNPIQTINKRLN